MLVSVFASGSEYLKQYFFSQGSSVKYRLGFFIPNMFSWVLDFLYSFL